MSPPTPNLSWFTRALEDELQLRGWPFDLGELIEWATAVWPLAQDNPDPVYWASRFTEAARPSV